MACMALQTGKRSHTFTRSQGSKSLKDLKPRSLEAQISFLDTLSRHKIIAIPKDSHPFSLETVACLVYLELHCQQCSCAYCAILH